MVTRHAPQPPHLLVRANDSVSALLLGVIQHGIRDLQINRIGAFRRWNHRDASHTDGDPWSHRRIVWYMKILHRLPDLFQVLVYFLRRVSQENSHKLLSPIAGRKIRIAVQVEGRRLHNRNVILVIQGSLQLDCTTLSSTINIFPYSYSYPPSVHCLYPRVTTYTFSHFPIALFRSHPFISPADWMPRSK